MRVPRVRLRVAPVFHARLRANCLLQNYYFCSSGSFCAPAAARASLAAPGPGIIKFGAFDGESTLSIFEFHCLLRPEYRLPCTPLKSFRLALALTTVIDYVQTGDVVWKGGEEAEQEHFGDHQLNINNGTCSCNTIHDVTMTHGPALIEFVPYVLGCVSINNILLRTEGVGGWVRKNLKLLRIGKNFR